MGEFEGQYTVTNVLQQDDRPYRPCVGIMLLNREGLIFVGNRIDVPGDHWQMPQGGIDEGESAAEAALREIEEEAGIAADSIEILRISEEWLYYDLPAGLSRRIWRGRYRGQKQKWVAARFHGSDDEIDLNRHHAEFADWRWERLETLPALIVPFKRETYAKVIETFSDLTRQ